MVRSPSCAATATALASRGLRILRHPDAVHPQTRIATFRHELLAPAWMEAVRTGCFVPQAARGSCMRVMRDVCGAPGLY